MTQSDSENIRKRKTGAKASAAELEALVHGDDMKVAIQIEVWNSVSHAQ